jgi:hypothetical protein
MDGERELDRRKVERLRGSYGPALRDARAPVDEGFRRVDADLRALNGRFDSLQRTMLQIGGGVIVALVGLIATQL